MSRSIAFFDFDGTLTTKDTLLEFIKFSKGGFRFWVGFLLHSPYLIAYKLKIISNQKAKEKILSYFFRKTTTAEFDQLCDQFASDVIPHLLRKEVPLQLKKLKEEGTEIVIVSASPENWIRKWTEVMQLQLIATRLQTKNQLLTGKIEGVNCHGEEKVRRIKEKFRLEEYTVIYCYGDTKGDLPMLSLGTKSYYKPFR